MQVGNEHKPVRLRQLCGGIGVIFGRDDLHVDCAVNKEEQAESETQKLHAREGALLFAQRIGHRADQVCCGVGEQRGIGRDQQRLYRPQKNGTGHNKTGKRNGGHGLQKDDRQTPDEPGLFLSQRELYQTQHSLRTDKPQNPGEEGFHSSRLISPRVNAGNPMMDDAFRAHYTASFPAPQAGRGTDLRRSVRQARRRCVRFREKCQESEKKA